MGLIFLNMSHPCTGDWQIWMQFFVSFAFSFIVELFSHFSLLSAKFGFHGLMQTTFYAICSAVTSDKKHFSKMQSWSKVLHSCYQKEQKNCKKHLMVDFPKWNFRMGNLFSTKGLFNGTRKTQIWRNTT